METTRVQTRSLVAGDKLLLDGKEVEVLACERYLDPRTPQGSRILTKRAFMLELSSGRVLICSYDASWRKVLV